MAFHVAFGGGSTFFSFLFSGDTIRNSSCQLPMTIGAVQPGTTGNIGNTLTGDMGNASCGDQAKLGVVRANAPISVRCLRDRSRRGHQVVAAVLLPHLLAMPPRARLVLAIADGRDARGVDAEEDEVVLRGLGSALAERQV